MFENEPRTPLQELLSGKRYHHDWWCSADYRKPMGCEGCSCEYSSRRREKHLNDLTWRKHESR